MIRRNLIKKRDRQEKKNKNHQDFKLKKKINEAIDKALHDFDETFLKLGKE